MRPGTPVLLAEQLRHRHQPALNRNRLLVPAGLRQHEQLRARVRQHVRQREDAADGADVQRRIEGARGSGNHAERRRRGRHEIRDLSDVAARLLHADDVRMGRDARHRGRQQVDAGDRGEVVEQDRHRRGVRDRRVVTDERVIRHLRLEEPRRADEHGVGAMLCRALRRADGRLRRFAAGADDEPA